MPGSFPHTKPCHRVRAFTLVEVMVVVVVIGMLAAAGIPTYRQVTMRAKVSAMENDLRQFSAVIQTYTTQNGHWPANGSPQEVPPELVNALPASFISVTPFGGVYKWNYDVSADGITAKAALIVLTAAGHTVSDDEEMFLMLDRQMDDGVLDTGNVQVGSTNSLVFIIEK